MKMKRLVLLPVVLCCAVMSAQGKDAGWQWYNDPGLC